MSAGSRPPLNRGATRSGGMDSCMAAMFSSRSRPRVTLDLRQHVRIEHDAAGILLARRVGGDGGRDHFALGPQTVALRLDQPRMILAQIEDAAEQDDEADHVGEDDPPQQRLGDEADERAVGQELVEPDAPREIADIAGDRACRTPTSPRRRPTRSKARRASPPLRRRQAVTCPSGLPSLILALPWLRLP